MDEPRKGDMPGDYPAGNSRQTAGQSAPEATDHDHAIDHAEISLPRAEKYSFPPIVRALHNSNFRLFWSGNFLSNIGTWMQNVAQGWLVLVLTGSAFWLGVVGFAGSIPFLFITLFGGVVADRVNKRRLLLVTQTVMMALAFLLAALAYLKVITVWEIALIAFLNGAAMAMNAPSYQAIVPRLVEREDLTNAIALNSAQFNMSRILGPSLGAYAMAAMGVAGNFFLNGLSFLAVLAALLRIRYPKEREEIHSGVLTSMGEGFRYVRSQPQMQALMGLVATASLLGIPFLTFIPYFARIQLHTGESGLGWLLAGSGSGAVMGAILVAARGTMPRKGVVIAVSGVVFFGSIVAVCYSHNFHLSAGLLVIEGFAAILMVSSANIGIQQMSSDAMRGRVMSIYATCFLGLPPLGSLLAGEMSRHLSTPHVLALMASVAALIFLVFLFTSRQLRAIE